MKKIVIERFCVLATAAAFVTTAPAWANVVSPKWPGSFTDSVGTTWSSPLPGKYANCISDKDALGNPQLNPETENTSVICDAAGVSPDHLSIIDSDAIRACEAIGGTLPTVEDYIALGKDCIRLPQIQQHVVQEDGYWTSTFGSASVLDESAYVFDGGQCCAEGSYAVRAGLWKDRVYSRARLRPVICVSHSGQTTFRTSIGSVFTKVVGPGKFGVSWKDPTGTIWSATLGDFYVSSPIQQSPAELACSRIGGTLPSAGDYENLISYFETTNDDPNGGDGRYFTHQGQLDFFSVFPDSYKIDDLGDYITSTMPFADDLYYFTTLGKIREFGGSSYYGNLRCIAR